MLESSASDLPLLVTHGAWIGWLALALAIAVGFAIVWAVRWFAARVAARTATDRLTTRPNVVRGMLRGSTEGGTRVILASSLAVDDGRHGTLRLHTRAAEVWIQTTAGRVTLEGTLDVVAGSRSRSARRRVPVPTNDPLLQLPAAKQHAWPHRFSPRNWLWSNVLHATVERLREGDEVVATAASDPALDTLRAPEGRTIEIAALRPTASVRGMQPLAKVMVAGALAVVGYLALGVFADRQIARCEDADREDTDAFLEIGNGHPCALATASLRRSDREAGWKHLDSLLEHDWYRDERTLRRLLAIAGRSGGCARQTRILAEHGQREPALALARRCGDRRAEHLQLVALGRFEEAANVAVPATADAAALPMPETLLAAGRWKDAAEAIAKLRGDPGRALGHPLGGKLDPDRVDEELARLACLASYAAALAADPKARSTIDPNCVTLRFQLLDSAAQSAAIDDAPALVAWSRGHWKELSWQHIDRATPALAALGDDAASPEAWFAKDALAALPADAPAEQRAVTLAWAAVAKVFEEDVPAAQQLAADAVIAARQVSDRYDWIEQLELLPAAVALHTPVTGLVLHPPRPEGWNAYKALDHPAFGTVRRRAERTTSWDLHRSTGIELAHRIGGAATYQPDPGEVLAILPLTDPANRAALLRQLAWSRPLEPATFSWLYLAHVIVSRASFRIGGMPDEAAKWDAIYRRYDAVLRDRERLVALMSDK